MASRLTQREILDIQRLLGSGLGHDEVVRRSGRSAGTVSWICHNFGAMTNYIPKNREGSLTLIDREQIMVGIAKNEKGYEIARRIDKSASTVSREIARNGGRDSYCAALAQDRADREALRPQQTKLGTYPKLLAQVILWLSLDWSPRLISAKLKAEYDNPEMQLSAPRMYEALYIQTKGTLKRELCSHLRTKRTSRKSRGLKTWDRIPNMVNISERPPEARDRAVPGHWEGDLIMGRANRSAVVTLVERSTRFVMLGRIKNHSTEEVIKVLTRLIRRLPIELRRSLTWDQGTEMADHEKFTIATAVQVYFCDPASPWQRGSNENTNGLLRQYLPRHTDLSGYSQQDLDSIARKLNGRPRETLDLATPTEKLAEKIALTA